MTDTPKRRGRPPTKPAHKRWEYSTLSSEGPIKEETLEVQGAYGWELVSTYVRFDTVYAVFKGEVA